MWRCLKDPPWLTGDRCGLRSTRLSSHLPQHPSPPTGDTVSWSLGISCTSRGLAVAFMYWLVNTKEYNFFEIMEFYCSVKKACQWISSVHVKQIFKIYHLESAIIHFFFFFKMSPTPLPPTPLLYISQQPLVSPAACQSSTLSTGSLLCRSGHIVLC